MKKSEIKEIMKEAVKESLNESFIANIIEIVVRTTEKTVERKLDENFKKILRKNLMVETKKPIGRKPVKRKKVVKKQIVDSEPEKKIVFSKDPVINKMLKQTMLTTTPGMLEEYGAKTPDMKQLGEAYNDQLMQENGGLNENVQLQIPTLSEDLGLDTLQGSVMDNKALANVFKKDYRKTLKKMKENVSTGLPEAVQFYEAK